MRYFLLSIATLSLVACGTARIPLSTQPPENNGTYKIDYLFEHDGCKVYRFYDMGNYVYFTNCTGQAIARTDSTMVINNTQPLSKNIQARAGQQDVGQQKHQ